ncbi:chaperonin 10-like protein [Mycena alexandri]|uniref:Chaperonin 10-like protein n=1 Tax=Mycena alexandri TaxID=1745969 RepID=A0AAD6SH98_9AGAR|nr:chaperonin 10-like protein [Mycena alexandri]
MILTIMLAAVYVPGNEKLVLWKNTNPSREFEDDEILLKVQVAATGVGHSDVCILDGGSLEKRSFVLGHEGCGIRVRFGFKVDKHAVREGKLHSFLLVDPRVHGMNGFPALYSGLGFGPDGAFAEYIIATADALVPVVSPKAAVIASDAGMTAYHAVKTTAEVQVKRGDKVLILGIGGLGHLAVQYAKHLVYVCDFKPAARKLALDLSAEIAFDLIQLADKTATGFTVNKTIDFVANAQTFNLAMAALRGNDINFPSNPILVLVSLVGTLLEYFADIHLRHYRLGSADPPELVRNLFAKSHVRAHHSGPLEKVSEVIDQVRASIIVGHKSYRPSLGHFQLSYHFGLVSVYLDG